MNSIPGCLHSFKLDEKHITIRRVRTVDRPEHSGDLEWHDRMGAALDGLYAALTESEES